MTLLFSKSIQEIATAGDGIRICIMRKPDFNASWTSGCQD
jgi:hypothetical protein